MDQIKQTLSDLMTITNKIQIFLKTAPKENLRTCKKGRNYQFYAEKKQETHIYCQKKYPGSPKNCTKRLFQKTPASSPAKHKNHKTVYRTI